jgi:ethanolamine utilization protein EutN
MLIARVVGSAVSTVKDERVTGLKLLLVRESTPSDELVGPVFVAADTVGAGEGELVLIARGSAARQTTTTKESPIDAAIMGILDSLEMDRVVTFTKS